MVELATQAQSIVVSLASRVTAISDNIFDPHDLIAVQLDDRLRTRCAAVIVLSHAEIEEEIESACRAAVDALEAKPPTGFAFLAWGLSSARINSPDEKDHAKQLKANGTVRKLAEPYRELVKSSNGISRKHLERLLVPLGIDTKALSLDMATLNAFGSKRGDAAHLSPLKARLQSAPSAVRNEAITAAHAGSAIVGAILGLVHALETGSAPPSRKRSILSRILGR